MGWGIVAMQENTYEATAQVYVNANSSLEIMQSGLAVDDREFSALDLLRQSILDRQQLEKVVQAAGPSRSSSTASDSGSLTDRVLERIEITSTARWNNLYRISYADFDQRKALAVVEAFVSTVSEDAMRHSGRDSDIARSETDSNSASKFNIVDPPTVDSASATPSQPMAMLLVLLISLGAGTGLAYWMGFRAPVFNSRHELSARSGLPVIGVMTHAWPIQANLKHRRDMMLFGYGAAALMLCFAVVLLI